MSNQAATTPPWLASLLVSQFRIAIDLCADATNHIIDRWIGPGSPICEDLLEYHRRAMEWPLTHDRGEVCYINPPYARPEALLNAARTLGSGVVATLNAATGTQWFKRQIWQPGAYIRFLTGRIKFGGYDRDDPRHDNMLIFWLPIEPRARQRMLCDLADLESHIDAGYSRVMDAPPRVGLWDTSRLIEVSGQLF